VVAGVGVVAAVVVVSGGSVARCLQLFVVLSNLHAESPLHCCGVSTAHPDSAAVIMTSVVGAPVVVVVVVVGGGVVVVVIDVAVWFESESHAPRLAQLPSSSDVRFPSTTPRCDKPRHRICPVVLTV
jgi:hypothetical protein